MEHARQIIGEILDRTEKEIRQLGAEAFRTGDDTVAGQARDAVHMLKTLRAQLNGRSIDPIPSRPAEMRERRRQSKPARRRSRVAGKSEYPKYTVRNGLLIRIGWSKKQKTEYQHKAPRDAFNRTVKAMARLAETGRGPFTAEKIIEDASDSTGSVPSYQAYVVIGLLRDHECVQQVGREGYTIPEDIPSRALGVWNELTGHKK